ncbi:MAG: pilus assembly protein PilM [Deltaproteobacteria bacterium]|nr:pilus assembly protein PilM [Deltaproteobacteria bacterium]
MPQTILGIDIGSYSVKVAEMVRTFKRFSFVHFYERKIQYSEVLTREESLAAALQGILEDNALTWDAAFVALPGRAVAARFIDFPFGQAKKIDQTLDFEVENHVPFPTEEIVYDYYIVKAAKVPPEAPYAICDIGHEKTLITICHGKALRFTRTLTIGGRHIIEAIADRLKIPPEEAERLLHEAGQAPVDDRMPPEDSTPFHVVKAIDVVLEELLLHVRQTFLAFRERSNEAVEGIYLCGGMARLAGIEQYLSLKLKQNVTFLNPLEFHFSQVERGEIHPAVAATAVALALRGVAAAGMADVNFRKGEFAYRGDVQQLGGGLRRAGIAVGLLMGIALGYFFLQYFTLTRKAAQLNREVAQLVTQALGKKPAKPINDATGAVRMLRAGLEETKERTRRLESVVEVSALEILKDISAQLPPRDQLSLDVERFELKEGQVQIRGKTTSFEAVDKIRDALGKSDKFENVQTSNVGKGVKDEIKFEVRFGVKGLTPVPKAKGKGT